MFPFLDRKARLIDKAPYDKQLPPHLHYGVSAPAEHQAVLVQLRQVSPAAPADAPRSCSCSSANASVSPSSDPEYLVVLVVILLLQVSALGVINLF